MYQRVIVPLDGSALAEQALSHGAAIAEKFDARLTLLRSFVGPSQGMSTVAGAEGGTGAYLLDQMEKEEAAAREYLEQQVPPLRARGLTVDTALVDAPAATAIADEAIREPDTLVVMSTRGRRWFDRLLAGSVAQDALDKLRVPLLLVHIDESAAAADGADISIRAEVMGTSGRLGEVRRVIVDPGTNRVTDLVVNPGLLAGRERQVPLGHVTRVQGGVVYVDLDAEAFTALSEFGNGRS